MTVSNLIVIALTIFLEASGEPPAGRLAVAEVIANRARERNIPAAEVCLQRFQFSPWNAGQDVVLSRYAAGRYIKTQHDQQIFDECLNLARIIEAGNMPIGHGWNYFFNPQKCSPSWGKKMRNSEMVGNHQFGTLP